MQDTQSMGNQFDTKKLRKTKARTIIISILSQDTDRSFSAEELHAACVAELRIDLSTVYRTMHTLVESGFITKSIHPNGKAYFQYAAQHGMEHHHRIVCSRCKASADIAVCPIHDFEEQIFSETGFTMTSHSIELTGLCPDCKAATEAKAHQSTEPNRRKEPRKS